MHSKVTYCFTSQRKRNLKISTETLLVMSTNWIVHVKPRSWQGWGLVAGRCKVKGNQRTKFINVRLTSAKNLVKRLWWVHTEHAEVLQFFSEFSYCLFLKLSWRPNSCKYQNSVRFLSRHITGAGPWIFELSFCKLVFSTHTLTHD